MPRMIFDVTPEVQMAIRLRAIKAGVTTGEVVTEAILGEGITDMSLTYTSALCNDGIWYKNPTWRGELRNNPFFVCLDDNEPPELVVAEPDTKIKVADAEIKAIEIINMLDFKCILNSNSFMKCGRNFSNRGKPDYREGFRFFLTIIKRPKPPTHCDTNWPLGEEPPEGVKYFFESGRST